MIGSSKFCLKSCGELNTCGVQSHEVKKFSPTPHDFYLKENEGRAFIKPALSGPELSMVDVQKILAKNLPLKEWEMIFADLQAGNFPEWMDGFRGTSTQGLLDKASSEDSLDELSDSTLIELDSPRISAGIFSVLPALSFDDEALDDFEEEAVVDLVPLQKVFSIVKENCNRFSRLKLKWSQTFAEVEASHLVVVKDLQKLKNSTVVLRNLLGKPDRINGNERPSLWCGLRHLSDSMGEKLQSLSGLQASSQNALETLQRDQLGLKQSMTELGEEQDNFQHTTGDRLAQIERCLTTYEQRFTKILPILLSVKPQNKSPTQESELQAFKMQLQEMEAKVLSLQEILWDGGVSAPPLGQFASSNVDEILRDLRAQVLILQQRVVGGGVQIGTRVFQSFEDVIVWVKAELPCQRYGLFVDAVSLLDFFTCIGHVDAEKTFAAFHSQQRSGFSSMYEARVAASIQNLFPMVFGKSSSSGLDDSEFLPAIQDPDKWDNGSTGLKHQICRGMSDVEYQLESAIESVLAGLPEAKQIAKECLYKAKRFVSELCNFITNDFHKWKHRGHSKRDAWKMTSVSVRRIFEEIHSERVVARDIYDQKNTEFTTAKFLWATWKAHIVMERYIKHQFYEHPAIAAVLARHLADNYVKPDDALATKLSSLDKAHKALVIRVDSLGSKEKENARAKNEKGKGLNAAG